MSFAIYLSLSYFTVTFRFSSSNVGARFNSRQMMYVFQISSSKFQSWNCYTGAKSGFKRDYTFGRCSNSNVCIQFILILYWQNFELYKDWLLVHFEAIFLHSIFYISFSVSILILQFSSCAYQEFLRRNTHRAKMQCYTNIFQLDALLESNFLWIAVVAAFGRFDLVERA